MVTQNRILYIKLFSFLSNGILCQHIRDLKTFKKQSGFFGPPCSVLACHMLARAVMGAELCTNRMLSCFLSSIKQNQSTRKKIAS